MSSCVVFTPTGTTGSGNSGLADRQQSLVGLVDVVTGQFFDPKANRFSFMPRLARLDKYQRRDQCHQANDGAQNDMLQGDLALQQPDAGRVISCDANRHEFRIRSSTLAVIRCARGSGPRGVV